MPSMKRIKTKYPGVFYIEGASIGSSKKKERIFYIVYRRDGKLIEEKAGRQFQDDMTPARASQIRTKRIQHDEPSNRERRIAIEAEKFKAISRWTIDRLWTEYKEMKPNFKGIVQDSSRFDKYIKPSFGGKEASEVLPSEVDRLRNNLMRSKSPATVRNVLELLRRIVRFGEKRRGCQGLSFQIEMPRVNNIKTEDLTPEELSRLLKSIEEDENPNVATFMKMVLFTGMRRSELFRLKWGDIDFDKSFIHIRDPKGGKDQIVPLNDEARHLLESYPRGDSPYIFPGRNGGQRVDINHQVNRIKKRAGLPKDFRALHGLRHVFASMLASSGQVDMYTLQKLMTHKSPQMTQRYAHLRDETLKRASALAGKIVKEAATAKDQEHEAATA